MKKSLLTATLTVAVVGAALGGACLATGNCQSKTTPASAPVASTSVALAQKSPTKTAPKEIRWFTSLAAAKQESKRTGKPIFADFYADWCPPCKMLEAQTYPDPKVIAESQKWVMLKIDTEKHTDLAVQYGISSLPTLAVMRADGKPVTGTTGFLDANDFVKFLRDVRKEVVKK
jgi:thioredoxin 1